MAINEKAARLASLKARIEQEHVRMGLLSDVWFWPERDGVKGFLGAAPIIVAGLNPSKGRGRPRRGLKETDEFFYRCLREEGLVDAHITDVVKIRATKKDAPLLFYNPTILKLHRDYFIREVKIVQPAVVVVVGIDAWNVLRGWNLIAPEGRQEFIFRVSAKSNVAVIRTVHPAATRFPKRTAERRARFRKDVRQAYKLAHSRGIH
ncbi:MAG: hypothetical protein QN141_08445 [Armatimonadota bacterium]|nr:hypothetical protein [Armatimonadota bacterium]MDR7451210.1 hypothetical protein [Armatimonadota bacterium]MDR7467185.1 hypothetical protein [Armatimonadota bacterium]MDR7495198.1 hypothetical protein [Armatimonadota bacterium]MDR7500091.1 hypothetical protein [Armatimonadota bacterium]